MKSERFTAGQLWIEATKHREGPPFVFVCRSGKSSMLFTDPKQLLKFVRWPKSTPTGAALRNWLAALTAPVSAPVSGTSEEALINVLFKNESDETAHTKIVT